MELVDGVPLTSYCDAKRLSVTNRLELFVTICEAVQHAHQKGVVPRDLKPSNILVGDVDGKPVPKVIDFGLVKALEAGTLPDVSVESLFGSIVGTPLYMAPEQTEPGGAGVDTRTDIYALGVVLYELLTGSTPLTREEIRRAAAGEVFRLVREAETPPPAARLKTALDLPAIAAQRGTEPARLEKALRGDLDWITLKCLEKEPSRRYETANGVAADILRHLAYEPVTAGPPSRWYRAGKFVRRHKVSVAAACLVAVSLVAAVAGISWQASVARAQLHKAERIAEFMADMLQGVEPGVARGRDTKLLQEMMTDAAARIEKGDLSQSPEAELRLRATIGTAFRELALYDEASRMLAPAVPLARSLYDGDHEETKGTDFWPVATARQGLTPAISCALCWRAIPMASSIVVSRWCVGLPVVQAPVSARL